MSQYSLTLIAYESCHVHGVVHLFSKIDSMLHCRLEFQPFCEPVFLAPVPWLDHWSTPRIF